MAIVKIFICVIVAYAVTVTSDPISSKGLKATIFLVTEEKVTVDQASRICDAHGKMIPVFIEDAKKNKEVKKYMASYEIGSVWTSGNDLETRNEYVWDSLDFVRPFSYTDWLKGAPRGEDSCRCVSFVSGQHSSCDPNQKSCSGWTVEPCSTKLRVLCQVPPETCDRDI